MTYAQIITGQPIALNPALAVTFEREGATINASYETVMLWSDDERAAIGVYPIVDDAIPEGKIATGSALENDNGVVRRRWTLEDAPPPPVPGSISDRQFAEQLAIDDLITIQEGLDWVSAGIVPAQLQAIVDAIEDADMNRSANFLLRGATIFERHHPMTEFLGAALGKAGDDLDAIWRNGALL